MYCLIQVVAGMIYHAKIDVGDGSHVHARIFKPLPHTGKGPTLQVAKGGFGPSDELKVLDM